jgi:ribosomal protein L37AE/L43A
MKVPSRHTSRPDHAVCPACGSGNLRSRGPDLASCDSCGRAFDGTILIVLEQIIFLPDARGKHACECGHPEMRRLPDGTFHCPACGSEVLPIGLSPSLRQTRKSSLANLAHRDSERSKC